MVKFIVAVLLLYLSAVTNGDEDVTSNNQPDQNDEERAQIYHLNNELINICQRIIQKNEELIGCNDVIMELGIVLIKLKTESMKSHEKQINAYFEKIKEKDRVFAEKDTFESKMEILRNEHQISQDIEHLVEKRNALSAGIKNLTDQIPKLVAQNHLLAQEIDTLRKEIEEQMKVKLQLILENRSIFEKEHPANEATTEPQTQVSTIEPVSSKDNSEKEQQPEPSGFRVLFSMRSKLDNFNSVFKNFAPEGSKESQPEVSDSDAINNATEEAQAQVSTSEPVSSKDNSQPDKEEQPQPRRFKVVFAMPSKLNNFESFFKNFTAPEALKESQPEVSTNDVISNATKEPQTQVFTNEPVSSKDNSQQDKEEQPKRFRVVFAMPSNLNNFDSFIKNFAAPEALKQSQPEVSASDVINNATKEPQTQVSTDEPASSEDNSQQDKEQQPQPRRFKVVFAMPSNLNNFDSFLKNFAAPEAPKQSQSEVPASDVINNATEEPQTPVSTSEPVSSKDNSLQFQQQDKEEQPKRFRVVFGMPPKLNNLESIFNNVSPERESYRTDRLASIFNGAQSDPLQNFLAIIRNASSRNTIIA